MNNYMSKILIVMLALALIGTWSSLSLAAASDKPVDTPQSQIKNNMQTGEKTSEGDKKQKESKAETPSSPAIVEKGFWTLFFDFISSDTASITKFGAFIVAIFLVIAGLKIMRVLISTDSPLALHAFELLAITFILPVLLIVGILTDKGQEAVVGVLGTIVGYVFGAQRGKKQNDGAVALPDTRAGENTKHT